MTAKKSGLGRGLEALIGPLSKSPGSAKAEEREITAGSDRIVVNIPVDKLERGASQPRHGIDNEGLQELSQSIANEGVLVPLLVRKHPTKKGSFEIVAGERRWRAAKIAGLDSVPVLVKDVADEAAFVLSLVENIQREDLNPIEEAESYQSLAEMLELTQDELAGRVGKERSSVANTLRLLKLPGPVKAEVQSGSLSMGHARAILGLSNAEQMVGLATKAVEQGLSVRQTENLVKKLKSGAHRRAKPREKAEPYAYLADILRRKLGTKVSVDGTKEKGRIVIHYFSAEDLKRIVDLLDD